MVEPLPEPARGAGAVEILGTGVTYLDGAEPELLSLMQRASDRSSGSDELMRHIHDWRSKYHLSPLRENLLLPLALVPGMRVLDVGCGTGALTRRLAESGAEVIGLEGSLPRAQVAAERVRGLNNAQILCGSLSDYIDRQPADKSDTFDLIVVCGVLEYSGSGIGGSSGPATMLDQMRSLLAPGGALVLAIENKWGLKYILSHPEDHLGRPWIGMEGYWRTDSGIRTWSRRELAEMLHDAGLTEQRWYAAYPDYKLPKVVVSEELLSSAEGAQLVKQFVRDPISDQPDPGRLAADPLLTFHSSLDAGLGMDTANSFLIVCGAEGAVDARLSPGLLWLGVSHRARSWRSTRVLRPDDTGAPHLEVLGSTGREENWPLVHERTTSGLVRGVNAEDALRHALVSEGLTGAGVRELMQRWSSECLEVLEGTPRSEVPFDLMLSNFIVDDAGGWHLVDTEFTWADRLLGGFVQWRSAMWTALRLCQTMGGPRGVAPETRLGDFVWGLLGIAGVDADQQQVDRYIEVEAQIQARVAGDLSNESLSGLARTVRKFVDSPVRSFAPHPQYLSLLAEHEESVAANAALTAELTTFQERAVELGSELALLRSRISELESTLARIFSSRRWRAAELIRHPKSGSGSTSR